MRSLQLVLKPSRLLAALLAGASLAVIVVLAMTPMPQAIRLLLVTIVVLACAWHMSDCLLRLSRSLVMLELNGKGELHVTRRDGETHQVHILPGSFGMPYLTILNMKVRDTGEVRHLLVTPDRVQEDEFRRLRVWLRWGDQTLLDADGAAEV